MSTTPAFARLANTLSTLNALAALAENTFGTAEGVISVHVHTFGNKVDVQMEEAHLLAWCAAHGLTPTETVEETDYTRYGGGFMTHRRYGVTVTEIEGGSLALVSCKQVSSRPAHPVTEQDAGVAVA